MGSEENFDSDLVPVFDSDDPGLLPLAEVTLRNGEIEFVVQQRPPIVPPALMGMPNEFSSQPESAIILVRAGDADRARELLADLGTVEQLADAHKLEPTQDEWQAEGPPPILLSDIDAGSDIGRITEAQRQQIENALEEDDETPGAYYITPPTIDVLQDTGVDPAVVTMLRNAIGDRESFLLRWQRLEP
jgi:hypothetical protein